MQVYEKKKSWLRAVCSESPFSSRVLWGGGGGVTDTHFCIHFYSDLLAMQYSTALMRAQTICEAKQYSLPEEA